MVMPRKVELAQMHLDTDNTLIMPVAKAVDVDPERAVRRFLSHVDRISTERFVMVDITTPLVGPLEMRVTCKHCGHAFIRRVTTVQQAYYTVHVMNEVTSRITFLPRFVKGAQQ